METPLAKFPNGDPTLPDEFDDNDFVYLENKEEDSGTTVLIPGKKFFQLKMIQQEKIPLGLHILGKCIREMMD